MRLGRSAVVGLSLVALSTACAGSDTSPDRAIRMDTIATLRFDSLYAPTMTATVAASSNGMRVAVSPDRGSGEIYLFERGELLARYSASGNGPHELSRVQSMAFGAADSLLVLDSENNKLLVLTPDFQFARLLPLSSGLSLVAAGADGTVYLAGASSEGVTLKMLDESGSPIELAAVRGGGAGPPGPALMAVSNGAVWFGSSHKYELILVDQSGATAREIKRNPGWWGVKPENTAKYEEMIGTETRLLGASAQPQVVWTIAGVPPEQYPATDPMELDFRDPEVMNQLGDHILEALDAESGNAIATLRLDELNTTLMPGGLAWRLEADPSGEPRILVVSLEVGE